MTFSFFCPVKGGPGEIRGRQMAEYLGGKFRPVKGFEDDICVYILGCVPNGPEPVHSHYDVMDTGLARLSRLLRRTAGGLIAVSETQREALMQMAPHRELDVIPQHHCNFARETIPERPVKRVGCIGGDSAVQCPHEWVARSCADMGLDWHFEIHYHRRWRVVQFYKTIDIQISYRPEHPRGIQAFMNPLKLSNAGSFGIPTVAYPEPAYVAEWKHECLWGETMPDILRQVKRLKEDPVLYAEMAARAKAKAETYHIEHIAPKYLALS